MHKWLLLLLFAVVPIAAQAQGVPYNGNVQTAIGQAVPNASVAVCTVTTVPCPSANLASVYSNVTLTTALTNPLTTSSYGTYQFFAAPGTYYLQISSAQILGTQTIPIALGSTGTNISNLVGLPVVVVDGTVIPTVAAALAKLPALGGTIDARGCAPSSLALGTYDPGSKDVILMLGDCTYTATQIIEEPGEEIIGSGNNGSPGGTTLTFNNATNGASLFSPNTGDNDQTSMVFTNLAINQASGSGTNQTLFNLTPSMTNTSANQNIISNNISEVNGVFLNLNGPATSAGGGENAVYATLVQGNFIAPIVPTSADITITGAVTGVTISDNLFGGAATTGIVVNKSTSSYTGAIIISGNTFAGPGIPLSNTGGSNISMISNSSNGAPFPDSFSNSLTVGSGAAITSTGPGGTMASATGTWTLGNCLSAGSAFGIILPTAAACGSGGSGTPAAPLGSLQFNNAGAFGAVAGSNVGATGGTFFKPTADVPSLQVAPFASAVSDVQEWFDTTAVSVPAVPTTGTVAGGTLAARTDYVKNVYYDYRGVSTTASAESSQAVALDFLLTVTSPVASAGAAGYVPAISSATGTETVMAVTSANCTLATGLPAIAPAMCAIGATYTEPTTGFVSGAAIPASNLTQIRSMYISPNGGFTSLGPFTASTLTLTNQNSFTLGSGTQTLPSYFYAQSGSGASNTTPAYFEASGSPANAFNSFLYPCQQAGAFCFSASTPSADSNATVAVHGGVNVQTATTYTFVQSDLDKLVKMNESTASTVTVPPVAAPNFNQGWTTTLQAAGGGAVTLAAGAGVTLVGTTTVGSGSSVKIESEGNSTYDILPGGGSLSGMTAGQLPVAATPTTVTSSIAMVGGGANPLAVTWTSPATGQFPCVNGSLITINCWAGVPVVAKTASYTAVQGDVGSLFNYVLGAAATLTSAPAANNWYASAFNEPPSTFNLTFAPASGTVVGGTVVPPAWYINAFNNGTNWQTLIVPTQGAFPNCSGTSNALTFNTTTFVLGCNTEVSSFTGDGTILSNSGSTGAVTATLALDAADTVLGNPTTVSAKPIATTNPFVTSLSTGTGCPTLAAGTSGTLCTVEGTPPSANQASADTLYADSTLHSPAVQNNGSILKSMIVLSEPSPVHLTAQVANIVTSTLCAAVAGACNQPGEYTVHVFVYSTVVCATPGTAAIGPIQLSWTDNASAKAAQTLPLDVDGGVTLVNVMALGDTTHWGSGEFHLWSTGAAAIQIATSGYTACTTGTGTYELDAYVTRGQ